VIAHDTQSVELEAVFGLATVDGIEQEVFAFDPIEAKVSVIAASGDVIAVVGLEFAGLSWHDEIIQGFLCDNVTNVP